MKRNLARMHGHIAHFAINADDLPATVAAAVANGELAFVSDPSGNVVGVMRFV